MIKSFIMTIILIAISFSVFAEVDTTLFTYETDQIQSEMGDMSSVYFLNYGENNCDAKDCNDSDGHCTHHCSGVHFVVLNTTLVNVDTPNNLSSNLIWRYSNKYKTLNIDPALKPPTQV